MNPSSSSFIRFQCTMHDWGVLFSESSSFYKLKRGDLISEGNKFCRKSDSILQKVCSPLVYFNFKSLMDTKFSSFIRFQCILHDSGVLFSEFWNFYKLKMGDLIFGGNQFCRKSELFGPPFYSSILKVLGNQLFRYSLDLNAFCMIQEYFPQCFEVSTN